MTRIREADEECEMAAAAWQDGIFAWEWDAWGMIVEP